MIVLDTAALIYWTIDPTKLSRPAREAIDGAERLIISSISVWEIALKVKRSRLEIGPSMEEYIIGLHGLEKLGILSVDVETWLKSVSLEWVHGDPADRTIVATASLLKCPLITPDRAMSEFYSPTIW